MTLPLPVDPDFRKAIVGFWLEDIDDRLEDDRLQDAETSWKEANGIYLSLPPGCGDMALEERLFAQRVKLDNFSHVINENNL